jgi:hypothetical protein
MYSESAGTLLLDPISPIYLLVDQSLYIIFSFITENSKFGLGLRDYVRHILQYFSSHICLMLLLLIFYFFKKMSRLENVYLQVRYRMKAPIYVYYELDNFYQNHRR